MTTTLAAKRVISLNVLAAYSRKSQFILDSSNRSTLVHNDISIEQVLDSSRDIYNHLVNNEKSLQTTLDNTVWRSINTQTLVVSFSSLITFSLLGLLIYCCGPQIAQKLRAMMTARRTDTSNTSNHPDYGETDQAEPSVPSPPTSTRRHHIYARPAAVRNKSPAPELYEMKTFS